MTPAHLDMDKCMTIHLDYELPEYPAFEEGYRRAPRRESHLTEADKILAIKNALRYIKHWKISEIKLRRYRTK